MNLREYIQIGKRISKILFLVCYNILLNNQLNKKLMNMKQLFHKRKEFQRKKKQKKKFKNYYMEIKRIERILLKNQ